MLDPIESESFNEREKKILDFWEKENIFIESIQNRKSSALFSFYDGPPFATGLPHYGHLLAGTIKDVIPRYKTMKGFCVPRRFGWDCHGLPIENEIEKSFGLSGAASIEEFGIAHFNEECRKIVLRYTEEWKKTVTRMGRWVDFSNTYRTMDVPFMESVWWVFKQLYAKGLVYEGFKVMPFSAKLGTTLSNFEAGENYKDVDDPSLTVAFPLLDDPQTSLLIWTTTPWTLVSNLAILIGPDIDYVKILEKSSGKYYILAQASLSHYFKEMDSYTIVQSMKGAELIGLKYMPAFSYFADRTQLGAFRVIEESSISTEEGTGLVHCAPAFGEVDFYAAKKAGIDLVCPVSKNGLFTEEIPEYTGQFVKDADKDIIRRLKGEGRVFHQATCHHRYPFCWRSDTPLIYRATSSWFVAVEKIKENLLASNREIHWTPEHIKFGRFGKWLEGARDWVISRNRYWGTPIPIWRAEDGELIVIGSIEELEKETGQKLTDLHRHFIDELVIKRGDKVFKRIPEVFDCWFESGSMPYAQNHYPFENAELFEQNFPADFIAEGLDQTRGWFYTLTILSTALFDQPAFKNVIVNGIILAEDGAKMSKRLRNYPDPLDVVEKYGADAIRLYMMHSPAVRGDDLSFSEKGVELVLRQILIPMWNAYSFFITYARIYHWLPVPNQHSKPTAVIDRWLLSLLNKLISQVEQGMDQYELSAAVEPFVAFVNQLTNWYIRRSRRRFWEEEASEDRNQAFATLYQTLLALSQIAAPFVPFMSESIYQNLRHSAMPDSVHLTDFPTYCQEMRDEELEAKMDAVQIVVSLGHSLRKEHKLKVRQPLAAVHIASGDPHILHFLEDQQHLIADELNVKKVEFSLNETEWVSLKAKPNFRVLGKKVGKLMKDAQQAINALNQAQLGELLEGKILPILVGEEVIFLSHEDVEVERSVHEGMIAANQGAITLALDTQLSEPLLIEGLARELINKLNTMRREAGFAVTDRIHIQIATTPRVEESFKQYETYIKTEVLALQVDFMKHLQGQEWDLNGEKAIIILSVVT
ncbi:MAG: isoleucine--tRNA ligase [Parachlamydia sp.]|nr:MAG: isoleucine--tRNA ligase [Parachlamydia sp.]